MIYFTKFEWKNKAVQTEPCVLLPQIVRKLVNNDKVSKVHLNRQELKLINLLWTNSKLWNRAKLK